MKCVIIKYVAYPVLFLFVFFMKCNDPKLSNPFDPASDDFIPRPAGLLIDDFDNPNAFNLLKCKREALWEHGSKIDTSFNNQPQNVLRGVGFSFKIYFDVSANDPAAYCSFSDLLTTNAEAESLRGQFNLWVLGLESIAYLQFWIKTESKNIDFEIALKCTYKDSSGNDILTDPRKKFSQCDVVAVKGMWQKIKIPVISLWDNDNSTGKEDVDNKSVREINFSFRQTRLKESNRDLKGTIYLDEISLERE